jgi:uncharacterized protein YacL
MSPLAFFEWLADTSWSVDLHESQYAYPLIESIHVWTMAVFFGSVVMFDLRLLGVAMRKVPASEVVDRLLPLTIAAFVIMVISGMLLFYAIPLRSYQSIFFRFKILLMLLAGLNVWIFHSRVYPKVATWDVEGGTAQARQGCRGGFPRIMDRHHLFGTNDRLQLVRLRSTAAAGHHQFPDQLRRH